ncbi:pentatricopeptide repeat-containing protein, chloroplastic-like protein [Cinnamomum micranthum f. kanehirae]|uniref:Pentatricopeptide repeat-containing protein, chloroplastic-like protein n=1 Tax=Cinnamomum micranthum f. kanehirae TaxID=337451 RepID=A0A3S4P6D5_9MAGN|nr:pentatricopeptide repeat-containing protein, chloroplastic-like protein [Cinnamomum micranthum f. kanehirae]
MAEGTQEFQMEVQLCILQKSQAELKEVSEHHGKLLIKILQRMEDLRTTKSSIGKTSQTNQVHSILDILYEQPVLNKDGDPNDEDLSVAGMEPVDFWSVGMQGSESGKESCMEKGRPRSSLPITSKREFSARARKMGEDSSLQTVAKRALRGSPWFCNSFVDGFHGVAAMEAIGPDLELTGCKTGDVTAVVICTHNLTVSFQGDEDAAGVGGIKLEVVDSLGDSEEVKELELVGASIKDVSEMNGQALSFDCMWGVLELGHARRMFKLGLGFAGSWNVMIGGQVKYGELQIVHQLFNEMPDRKVTSWDSLIPVFSESGQLNYVIVLYERVREHTVVL